jgi:DNA topoisomerase IA
MRDPRPVRSAALCVRTFAASAHLTNSLCNSQGQNNDNAHPPIYPTKWAGGAEGGWPHAKAALYEFICRHFLACVSPDAAGDHTLVTAQLGSEEFTTTGLMIRNLCVICAALRLFWCHLTRDGRLRPTEGI